MNTAEVLTIIGSILIPMFAGFGWIIHQISDIKMRLAVVETVLMMMGAPIKSKKTKEIE
jgi:hypothetical protein